MGRCILYSTERYHYLAYEMRDAMKKDTEFLLGVLDRHSFPDGERYIRIAGDIAGEDVAILGGTISDADTMEIYDLACALVKYGARRLTLIIPYFGYSTMERAVKTGEVVPAKTRARLLSSIPACPEGNRVILLDLHAEGIPHYFEGGIRPIHVYAKPVILEIASKELGAEILGCTDAGRAKWVESLANDLGISAAFVFKKRIDGSNTKVTAVSAQVAGKRVVIYDDMIRTGGSLVGAARAYKEAGAASIAAITTHGLFCGLLEQIFATGLFSEIYTTDSHPNAVHAAPGEANVNKIPCCIGW